jgi:hypothetical protein
MCTSFRDQQLRGRLIPGTRGVTDNWQGNEELRRGNGGWDDDLSGVGALLHSRLPAASLRAAAIPVRRVGSRG